LDNRHRAGFNVPCVRLISHNNTHRLLNFDTNLSATFGRWRNLLLTRTTSWIYISSVWYILRGCSYKVKVALYLLLLLLLLLTDAIDLICMQPFYWANFKNVQLLKHITSTYYASCVKMFRCFLSVILLFVL